MKTSKSVLAIVFVSAICVLLDIRNAAWGHNLKSHPLVRSHAIAQAPALTKSDLNPSNKDLNLPGGIGVTRNSADKTLLTVTGSIENVSDKPHFVYYIVAKLIVNDTSIKQTIIPVNSDIEPGKSKQFSHEVSTNTTDSKVPAAVVVKYEYR